MLEEFRKPESVTDGDPNLEKKEQAFLEALGQVNFDEFGKQVTKISEPENPDANIIENRG